MRLRETMARIKCLFRVLFWVPEDDSILNRAAEDAKRRHDHAVQDLHSTMEELTSNAEDRK